MGAVPRQLEPAVAMKQSSLIISGTERVEIVELIGQSLTVRPQDQLK